MNDRERRLHGAGEAEREKKGVCLIWMRIDNIKEMIDCGPTPADPVKEWGERLIIDGSHDGSRWSPTNETSSVKQALNAEHIFY